MAHFDPRLDVPPPLSVFEEAYKAPDGAPWDVAVPQPELAVAISNGEVLYRVA